MAEYKPHDYGQTVLLPTDYSRQLLPGTFEHTLNYLVDRRRSIRSRGPQAQLQRGQGMERHLRRSQGVSAEAFGSGQEGQFLPAMVDKTRLNLRLAGAENPTGLKGRTFLADTLRAA